MDTRGLVRKFEVRRVLPSGGVSEPLTDFTFTLRPEVDPVAVAALLLYADVISEITQNASPLLAEVEVFLKDIPNQDGEGTMYDVGVKLYNQVLNGICGPR